MATKFGVFVDEDQDDKCFNDSLKICMCFLSDI